MINVVPVDARVGVNGTATFECGVTGNPAPTAFWSHEGTNLLVGPGQSYEEGRISVNSLNTLTIKNVNHDDEGHYVCMAVGIAGSSLARTHLEVRGVSDMPPPIIAVGAPNQTLEERTEGEMPCEARGTPEPTIRWFKADKLVRPDGRTSITPLGTLRINSKYKYFVYPILYNNIQVYLLIGTKIVIGSTRRNLLCAN